MKVSSILAILLALISLSLPACSMHKEGATQQEQHKIVLTSPKAKDVVITQEYVCQIRSRRHINVCAKQSGYLDAIQIKEGQEVKTGAVLFEIIPVLYQARYETEVAEVNLAQLEYNNTKKLAEDNVKAVSQNEVLLYKAKLDKAKAKLKQSKAELDWATVIAPFDGIVDRLHEMHGSLISEGDTLTTLSDNSLMWVYFNVPEVRYLEYKKYMAGLHGKPDTRQIELVLADGSKFSETGKIGAIEAQFNNETGNIPFRADFPNPQRLLRHGQTGNVLIHQTLKNAIVIPQRATFEVLDKRYVYVVDKDGVVHQRDIEVAHEKDDIFVLKPLRRSKRGIFGLAVNDRIVLEGVRQVHDGEKVEEYEFRKPEEALANQKNPAE